MELRISNLEFLKKILPVLIFITILLSPLYVVRWEWFGVLPTTLLEASVLATIAVWGVGKILRKDFSWPKTSFDKPILLFLLAAVISLFITPDLRGGLGVFKAYIAEPILFFYILVDTFSLSIKSIKSEALDKGPLKLIFLSLLLSGLWVSLLGIMQVVLGIGVVTPHEAAAGRAHAVYNTANAVGLYIGPIFALALGFLSRGKNKEQKVKSKIADKNLKLLKKLEKTLNSDLFLIFSLCYLLFAIFLSRSTGALVGLAAVFGVFLLFRLFGVVGGFRVMRTIGVVGVVVGMLFFLSISRFAPKVENPWERPAADTLTPRLCLWEGTKNLLWERPIFGAGLSGFKELYSREYFTCDAEPLEYPHNLFLNFWVELGGLGLIAFLWILWGFYKRIRELEIRELDKKTNSLVNQFSNPLRVGLTAAMVYLLVHGLVDVPYFKNDLALEFWVIIAMLEILARRQFSLHQNQQ